MANIEPFLINPPRKRKSSKRTRTKTTKTRRAKTKSKRVHRPVLYEVSPRVWSRSSKSKSKRAGIKINPAKEVIVVGANPVRRKRKRRTIKHRSNAVTKVRRRNPIRKRSYRRNPVRRRVYRRNPVGVVGKLSSLAIPVAVGVAANITTEKVPGMIGVVSPLPRFGVQMAVALAPQFIKGVKGSANAKVWTIVSLVTIASEFVKEKILGSVGATTAMSMPTGGFHAFPQITDDSLNAFPDESADFLGASPYEDDAFGY